MIKEKAIKRDEALEQPCEDCVSKAELKKWLDYNVCSRTKEFKNV